MRVSVCKHYCPSICFSKSSVGLHTCCTLKLEDVRPVTSSPAPVPHVVKEKVSDEKIEVEKNGSEDDGKVEVVLKSCLKKPLESDPEEGGKGKVKWLDFVGKELAEIKEFEAIESGETQDDGNGNQLCICVIQ